MKQASRIASGLALALALAQAGPARADASKTVIILEALKHAEASAGSTPAAGLRRGISPDTRVKLLAALKARLDDQMDDRVARDRAESERAAAVLAPVHKEAHAAFEADARSGAFVGEFDAVASHSARLGARGELEEAHLAMVQLVERHQPLFADIAATLPDTAALRGELADALEVSPDSIQREGSVLYRDRRVSGELEALIEAGEADPPVGDPLPSEFVLTPPFSQAEHELEEEQLGLGSVTTLFWVDREAAPATVGVSMWLGAGLVGGEARGKGWVAVGEDFTVEPGFERLRVVARLEVENNEADLSLMVGGATIDKGVFMAVAGPQTEEGARLSLMNVSFWGSAPLPNVPGPPTPELSESDPSFLELPVALEFDIPASGGEFVVLAGIDSRCALYGGFLTTVSLNCHGSARVISFEIEALEE